jgi:uncharacterized FlaG/YvyC family protein
MRKLSRDRKSTSTTTKKEKKKKKKKTTNMSKEINKNRKTIISFQWNLSYIYNYSSFKMKYNTCTTRVFDFR